MQQGRKEDESMEKDPVEYSEFDSDPPFMRAESVHCLFA
jgi:hypothetical protein